MIRSDAKNANIVQIASVPPHNHLRANFMIVIAEIMQPAPLTSSNLRLVFHNPFTLMREMPVARIMRKDSLTFAIKRRQIPPKTI